jgi:hypothetical protein
MRYIQKHTFKDIQDIIDFIQLECSPYFSQTDQQLYRGMETREDVVVYYQRADRKPVDTPPELHKVMDERFRQLFGHPYRSNALFTTGHVGFAAEYGPDGKPSIVILIGKFTFCWSQDIDDLYNIIPKMVNYDDPDIVKKVTKRVVDEGNYVTTNLDTAISSEHEIMINCPNGFVVLNDEIVNYFSNGKATVEQVWKELI